MAIYFSIKVWEPVPEEYWNPDEYYLPNDFILKPSEENLPDVLEDLLDDGCDIISVEMCSTLHNERIDLPWQDYVKRSL